MFTGAIQQAAQYTWPIFIAMRLFDGRLASSVGSCIVLNDEGWVLTAAHVMEPWRLFEEHKPLILAYQEQTEAIQRTPQLSRSQKKGRLSQLRANDAWITHRFGIIGPAALQPEKMYIHGELDLAVVHLKAFAGREPTAYATVQATVGLGVGTMLCKLGFPFAEVAHSFDPQTEKFNVTPHVWPPPLMPLEGMFTRLVSFGQASDGLYERLFIETSSPGIKGQSGGPLFDAAGHVWGLQSQSLGLDLDFQADLTKGGRRVQTHEMKWTGLSVHANIIVAYLRQRGIRFQSAED